MRVARYFPLVVVTGLVCQAAMPFTACASDGAAIDMTEQSSEPQPKGRYIDGAVQQANYYDSRPQTELDDDFASPARIHRNARC